ALYHLGSTLNTPTYKPPSLFQEALITLEGHCASAKYVAISPDGQRAVSASDDCTLKVWNLATGQCTATFWGDSSFYTCAIALDGVTVVAGDQTGMVHFFRLEGIELSTA
ncbi:hypothetical protein C7293_24490, partial [filamentous cyanobacterium CCT1]